MTGLRDAWRRHKQKIKKNFFDKNSTLEDMLAKCPDGIPHNQFRQLIEYWKHPTVQAICEMNSQNRKKQKWRHRMGPINFGRVRVALRAAKDNNEEPSKPEIFIASRTKKGKEIQADTQVAIAELQNRQNSGETADDAFRAVFGKEQPGRVRCYCRSVTTSSLKKDEEINNLKQKHADEITSLKEELREEMRHLFTQLLQNNPGLNFQDTPGCVGSNLASPIDASSAQVVRGTNHPYSSGSSQDSVLQKIGHKVRDCPNIRSQEKGTGQVQASATSSEAKKRNHFYALRSSSEQEESRDMVTGMIHAFSIVVYVLLYPGDIL
ncbi:uncharacterized protein LOC107027508 [Solanum pennellii]|uniref:Uncharacterized protein LOC107027508 n=1 Tax=Solanum pennellii TaxID=28526 RepID=A0ABM1VH47_SOLPN|nr:uncharacterized protein LOC107027508 [Solanum pennellii]